jgi:hypothetical protein
MNLKDWLFYKLVGKLNIMHRNVVVCNCLLQMVGHSQENLCTHVHRVFTYVSLDHAIDLLLYVIIFSWHMGIFTLLFIEYWHMYLHCAINY